MSFTVLPNATMEATCTGATPGVSYAQRNAGYYAIFHLTRNSGGIVANTMRNAADISAIRIKATIMVQSTNPREDLAGSDLRFRFIQFFAVTDHRAYYAGPASNEGNMYLDFASQPAFSGEGDAMLDSESKSPIFPYFEMYPPQYVRLNAGLWRVTIAMDDHPFTKLPLRLTNFYTRKDNYLCTASKEFNVVTALVVRDFSDASKPKLTFLGSMVWGAQIGCSFHWSKGPAESLIVDPAHYGDGKRFYCNDPRIGPDRDLTSTIEGLTDATETYNDAANAALVTVLSSNSVNRNVRVFEKWSSDKVGEKFFK